MAQQTEPLLDATRDVGIGAGMLTPGLEAGSIAKALPVIARTAIGGGIGASLGESGGRRIGSLISKDEGGEVGGTIGALGGGLLGGGLAAGLERNPATPSQSERGLPGSIKSLPLWMQRFIPEWAVPKGEVGSPTNPGWYSALPAKMPAPAAPPEVPFFVRRAGAMPEEVPSATPVAENPPGPFAKIPTKMPASSDAVSQQIVSPNAPEALQSGSEGRPATWTNEDIGRRSQQGNRAAIQQKILRGLPLSDNERYIMGDPNYPRAEYNPRETTKFTPEGTPIRNMQKAPAASRARILPQP